MHIGCGVYQHTVRGRRYLYFWHYETARGRRHQVKDYLGPSHSDGARAEGIRRCNAYFRNAARDLDRLRRDTLRAIVRGG